jgi:hypothetical protein
VKRRVRAREARRVFSRCGRRAGGRACEDGSAIWPGDTFGISTLAPGRVALSRGSATLAPGKNSQILATTVTANFSP